MSLDVIWCAYMLFRGYVESVLASYSRWGEGEWWAAVVSMHIIVYIQGMELDEGAYTVCAKISCVCNDNVYIYKCYMDNLPVGVAPCHDVGH